MSDLRPCPFCGSEPEPQNGWIHHAADCFFVRIGLGQIGFADLNANWNTRAADTQAEKLAGLLLSALRDLRYLDEVDGKDGDLPERIAEALAAYDASKETPVQTHAFDHIDEVKLRLSDANDAEREARMRRRTIIMDQDGVELICVHPPAQQIVDSEQLTLGCSWTAWDYARHLAPWATIGFIIGAVIVALIFRNT